MSIRVLVADDHPVIHHGLAQLFKNTDFEIVGGAVDGAEAVEMTATMNPDVVLMDVRMPGQDGLSALEEIKEKSPDAKVVMFSTHDNPTYVARALALGANDYILKSDDVNRLFNAMRGAIADLPPGDDSLMVHVKNKLRKRHDRGDDSNPLTNREMQVLRHVAMGLSNREIGKSLGISVETVKEHVQNILRKVNAKDRTQAAVWAVRQGFV